MHNNHMASELPARIDGAIAAAMKARDQARLGPLRMLKTALTNKQVQLDHDLEQDEAIQVVASLVKQRRDSIEQFTQGGRADLADKEKREIAVLEEFLPPAMAAEELEAIVRATLEEVGATTPKDIGPVMKGVMTRVAGRGVDGKAVRQLVQRLLGG